ncbi:MAG: folylpolyglutamate synthase/dihydrofolate synthase family protein [Methylococcaceae bacterium]
MTVSHLRTLADWLDWQDILHPRRIDMGLERIKQVYQRLVVQPKPIVSILIGGTNGKGSCVAFFESIVIKQGYKVGAFTSPHIIKYNERIKINGVCVSDEELCRAFDRIEAVRNNISLSYFEFATLAALFLFNECDVDIQLLEVGMGGRLDAVNIIEPDASIVSSIGLDHCQWLGHSRQQIGMEKAGIFRSDKPAIVGDLDPPESLLAHSHDINARLLSINDDFSFTINPEGTWNWSGPKQAYQALPKPGLLGTHQYRNAASVLMSLKAISDQLPVSEENIRRGLAEVKLTGRVQLVPGKIPVLLDVSHNLHSVAALLDHLNTTYPDKTLHAVFSMMKDKNVSGVLDLMRQRIKFWYFVPLSVNRAIDQDTFLQLFSNDQSNLVYSGFLSFNNALDKAKDNAKIDKDSMIVVFGSFYLVTEFFNYQGNN